MTYPSGWLTLAQYKHWARVDDADTVDDLAIQDAVDAVASAVETRCPYAFTADPDTGDPIPVPADVVYAGLLWTNRALARRNTPDGVVGVPDLGLAVIRSYDADIREYLSPWLGWAIA